MMLSVFPCEFYTGSQRVGNQNQASSGTYGASGAFENSNPSTLDCSIDLAHQLLLDCVWVVRVRERRLRRIKLELIRYSLQRRDRCNVSHYSRLCSQSIV